METCGMRHIISYGTPELITQLRSKTNYEVAEDAGF